VANISRAPSVAPWGHEFKLLAVVDEGSYGNALLTPTLANSFTAFVAKPFLVEPKQG
jgi:hypothetical protein